MRESPRDDHGRPASVRSTIRPGGWLLVLATLLALPVRADVHVAPSGNDAGPGTEAQPFATLERARKAVRDLKAAGPLPAGGLTVWIRSGDHLRTNALELTEADSGGAGAPIVWRGDRDGRAWLLGGRVVSGWRPVSDPAVRERLDGPAREAVR